MASNYRNSAGTDLDVVFGVCSSNLGAIGFKIADGVDLGNRYGIGSLGYNVGYKNSAGTDLGYLRGIAVDVTFKMYCGDDGTSGYRDRGFRRGSFGSITYVSGTTGIVETINKFEINRGGMDIYFSTGRPWSVIHATNVSTGSSFNVNSSSSTRFYLNTQSYIPSSGTTHTFRFQCYN